MRGRFRARRGLPGVEDASRHLASKTPTGTLLAEPCTGRGERSFQEMYVAHEIAFAFFRWFSLHYFLRSIGVTPKQAVGRQRDSGWFKISFGECFFENWQIFYPRPHETELV